MTWEPLQYFTREGRRSFCQCGGSLCRAKEQSCFHVHNPTKKENKKKTYLAYFLPPAAPDLYIQLENVQNVVQVKHFRYVRNIMYMFNGS